MFCVRERRDCEKKNEKFFCERKREREREGGGGGGREAGIDCEMRVIDRYKWRYIDTKDREIIR